MRIPPQNYLDIPESELEELDTLAASLYIQFCMLERRGNTQAVKNMLDAITNAVDAGREPPDGTLNIAVLYTRLKAFSPTTLDRVAPAVLLFCGGALSDRPGVSVMWAWTLHRWVKLMEQAEQKDGMTRGIMNLSVTWTSRFRTGVPSRVSMGKLWDAQKCMPAEPGLMASDNLLDYRELWDADYQALMQKVKPHPHFDKTGIVEIDGITPQPITQKPDAETIMEVEATMDRAEHDPAEHAADKAAQADVGGTVQAP